MTTRVRHIRNPEAPPRRVDRPRFGEDTDEDRWPLARLRQRWGRRLARWLGGDCPSERVES